MQNIRQLVNWLVIGLQTLRTACSTILVTIFVAPLIMLVSPFDPEGRRCFSLGCLWSRLYLGLNGVRLHVVGRENIESGRSCVFIANHASNLDPSSLAIAVDTPVRFVVKSSLRHVPLFGQAAKMAHMIFVERSSGERAVQRLQEAAAEMKDGISACFFAEGTRSRDGQLGTFKKGGFMLALSGGLPVVPVTVIGSHRLFPVGSARIRPGVVTVVIGEPVETAGRGLEDRDALMDEVHGIIADTLAEYGEQPDSEPDMPAAA